MQQNVLLVTRAMLQGNYMNVFAIQFNSTPTESGKLIRRSPYPS